MLRYSITGAILAGGQATRMGGADKGLVLLDEMPLYQHVLRRLAPQVATVMISANRNIEEYKKSGCAVFPDSLDGFKGPLAGILTILENSPTEWVAFSSCDTPLIPQDLVKRLWNGKNNRLAAYVNDGTRVHPTLCLLHTDLSQPLQDYLAQGDRKLMIFLESQQAVAVDFHDIPQAFKNINTPDECVNWNK